MLGLWDTPEVSEDIVWKEESVRKSLTPKRVEFLLVMVIVALISPSFLEKLMGVNVERQQTKDQAICFQERLFCCWWQTKQCCYPSLWLLHPTPDPSHPKEPGVSSSFESPWQAGGIPCALLCHKPQLLQSLWGRLYNCLSGIGAEERQPGWRCPCATKITLISQMLAADNRKPSWWTVSLCLSTGSWKHYFQRAKFSYMDIWVQWWGSGCSQLCRALGFIPSTKPDSTNFNDVRTKDTESALKIPTGLLATND